MSSTIAVLLILVAGFVMAIGYANGSTCLGNVSEGYSYLCWNPTPWNNQYATGAFGFFFGAVILTLGTIILVGPNVARSLGKWRSAEPDSDR